MNELNGKKKIIANRLREARKLAGFSQGQVAKLLNMHRPTISEIEAGNRSVSAEELVQFTEIYDVGIGWLSGQDAEGLDPHDDRLQLALRELNRLKPDDIERLMRVLAVMRKGSNQAGGTFEWTEEKNARRCHLIDKKFQGVLSADESDELESLQNAMRHHVNRVAPLPFDAARRLHAELLQKQESKH
jgi:transcriptional regulator with XRE-family HTH domain